MDQIKNQLDGNLSSCGQVLGKAAESNTPSMYNVHRPDADVDTHACPTSILLKLNQNNNLVHSHPRLESNILVRVSQVYTYPTAIRRIVAK